MTGPNGDAVHLVGVPRAWIEPQYLASFEGLSIDLIPFDAGQRLDEIDQIAQLEALACDRAVSLGDLRAMSSMRLLSFRGTGVTDYVDLEEAHRHGIAVANVRDYASVAVAELAIGLMFAVTRAIPVADQRVRSCAWPQGRPWGRQLAGLQLGLIGLGSIGKEVARLAAALGLGCVYWSPGHDEVRSAAERVTLSELLRSSDIVSLHLALSPQTRGLIGSSELNRMKPDAVLINTARAGLVDTDALVDAITSGRIGGAALDVFDVEPLPQGHALLELENVVLTPHIGAATAGAIDAATRGCFDNIARFIAGAPQNLVAHQVTADSSPSKRQRTWST